MENNDNNHFIIDLPIGDIDKVKAIYQIIDLQPLFSITPDAFWEFVNDFIWDMTNKRTRIMNGKWGDVTIPAKIQDLSIEELKKVYEYLTKDMKERKRYIKDHGDKLEDPRD